MARSAMNDERGERQKSRGGGAFFFSATIFPYLRFSAYMLALLCVWCAVGLAPLRPGAGSGAWRVVHRPAVRHSATTLSELETDDAGKSHPLCRAERSQLIRQLSVAAAAVLLQRVCTATARLHRCCAPPPSGPSDHSAGAIAARKRLNAERLALEAEKVPFFSHPILPTCHTPFSLHATVF